MSSVLAAGLAVLSSSSSPIVVQRSSVANAAPESSSSTTTIDYNAVAKDIKKVIENSLELPNKDYGTWGPEDKSAGPTLIRLAWHSSGTFAPHSSPIGGSEKGTLRFKQEQEHEANAGLAGTAVEWMQGIHDKYPGISYGDLYTLGGVVAVKTLGGPKVPWAYGRIDGSEKNVPPEGRLPEPATPKGSAVSELDADHLRQVFNRMGFNDQDIVVLSGAHAVGRCHDKFSGYDGPWQFNELVFDNSYYRLLNLPNFAWRPRRWDGPTQYRLLFTRPESVMMLPTDIILKRDREFRKHVRKYANDQDEFFKDFAVTFDKLLTSGTDNLTYIDLDF